MRLALIAKLLDRLDQVMRQRRFGFMNGNNVPSSSSSKAMSISSSGRATDSGRSETFKVVIDSSVLAFDHADQDHRLALLEQLGFELGYAFLRSVVSRSFNRSPPRPARALAVRGWTSPGYAIKDALDRFLEVIYRFYLDVLPIGDSISLGFFRLPIVSGSFLGLARVMLITVGESCKRYAPQLSPLGLMWEQNLSFVSGNGVIGVWVI